jgi:hypothetical protein
MTEAKRQTLEDAWTSFLASAETIPAVLAGAQPAEITVHNPLRHAQVRSRYMGHSRR